MISVASQAFRRPNCGKPMADAHVTIGITAPSEALPGSRQQRLRLAEAFWRMLRDGRCRRTGLGRLGNPAPIPAVPESRLTPLAQAGRLLIASYHRPGHWGSSRQRPRQHAGPIQSHSGRIRRKEKSGRLARFHGLFLLHNSPIGARTALAQRCSSPGLSGSGTGLGCG